MHPRAWFAVAASLYAGVLAGEARAVAPDEYPELGTFIERMVTTYGFKHEPLQRLFARARIRAEILSAMDRPREALPWHEYQRAFLTDQHVRQGKQYWTAHKAVLERARRDYGVPPEIIVAIIGVETEYGRNQGDFPAIDALTTLALAYPRRAEFFRTELEEYLLLTRELKLDPTSVKGSYAGALGIPQFIPSSYRNYAVDFNGDRRRDLLNNNADAIGSVAHFLNRHGWERGGPVLDEARLEGALSSAWLEQLGPKPVLSVRQLLNYGIFPRTPAPGAAADTDPSDRAAALIVLEGEAGPLYHLGYNNFYVLTRYNRSKRYATAVYQLGLQIRRAFTGEP